MRRGRWLLLLVTAHLVLWLLFVVWILSVNQDLIKVRAPFGLRYILFVPLLALTFAQVSLLGIWTAFSSAGSCYRLLGLVVGTVYLESFFEIASDREFLYLPSVAMALTVAPLLVVRGFGVRFYRRADEAPSSSQASAVIQLSTRDWMALTVVVAVLIAAARGERGAPGHFHRVFVILAVCFVAASLLALWAVCAPGGSRTRCLLAAAVSPLLGAFFGYAADAHGHGWVYILTAMLLYSAVLLGSLLVVRWCGYGLSRRSASLLDVSGDALPADEGDFQSAAN
jgi:hypothetical protein